MKYLKLTLVLSLFLSATAIQLKAQNAELAKQLSNPVANLISLPIQNNMDMGIGEFGGSKLTTNVQPVIPISLSEEWLLITRTIVPIVSQFNVSAQGSSEFVK